MIRCITKDPIGTEQKEGYKQKITKDDYTAKDNM